jgi:hypothetical protein
MYVRTVFIKEWTCYFYFLLLFGLCQALRPFCNALSFFLADCGVSSCQLTALVPIADRVDSVSADATDRDTCGRLDVELLMSFARARLRDLLLRVGEGAKNCDMALLLVDTKLAMDVGAAAADFLGELPMGDARLKRGGLGVWAETVMGP